MSLTQRIDIQENKIILLEAGLNRERVTKARLEAHIDDLQRRLSASESRAGMLQAICDHYRAKEMYYGGEPPMVGTTGYDMKVFGLIPVWEAVDAAKPAPGTITVMSDFEKADKRISYIGIPEIDFEAYYNEQQG
jgi:hypothetical protein